MRVRAIGRKGDVYNDIYRDVFELHKRYFNAGRMDPDEWVWLARDAGAVYDKYDGPGYGEFARKLLDLVYDDVSGARKARERQ